jgi:hypothetical protein
VESGRHRTAGLARATGPGYKRGVTLRLPAVLVAAAAALAAAAPVSAATPNDVYRNYPRTALINLDAAVPSGVGAGRFADLTLSVAAGWSRTVTGSTLAEPGYRDGTNAIGFSNALPDQVLGAYIFWARRVYKPKKVCKGHRPHRRCHKVKRYAYTAVPEADVAFNAGFDWNAGPRYPRDDEIDLASVEIHELGHFHDPNDRHGARCSGSPLTESLGYGEWWRDYEDWHEVGCDNSPAKRIGDVFPAGEQPRYQRIVHWLPDRVVSRRAAPR